MKAFEAWRDQKEVDGIEEGFRYGNRAGWRGVLECILEMKIKSTFCKTELDVLRAWIKQELEEKK